MSTAVQLDLEVICDTAQKNGQSEALAENLFLLALLLQKNYDVRSLLTHKSLSPAEKISIIKESPGFKSSPIFDEILYLLLKNNQIKTLPNVYEKISTILNEKQNQMLVHVETAIPLTEDFSNKISNQLADIFKKQIILKAFVNTELVAGILVKLPGGKVYDYSYERLLSDFKHYLRERN